MRRRPLPWLALGALVVLMSVSAVSAHELGDRPTPGVPLASDVSSPGAEPGPHTVMAVAWTPGSGWPLLAIAVAGLLVLAGRRPRGVLGLGLALALSLFAFENGVHSVHHLGDERHAAQCAIAAAATHLAGLVSDCADVQPLIEPTTDLVATVAPTAPTSCRLGPDLGRAPPSLA